MNCAAVPAGSEHAPATMQDDKLPPRPVRSACRHEAACTLCRLQMPNRWLYCDTEDHSDAGGPRAVPLRMPAPPADAPSLPRAAKAIIVVPATTRLICPVGASSATSSEITAPTANVSAETTVA